MLKDRLKRLRQELGLTQEELAKKLNITRKSISAYETGRATPTPEMLKVIAEFFNVTTDYLLGISKINMDAYVAPYENDLIEKLKNKIKTLEKENKELKDKLEKIKTIIDS